MRRSTAVLLAVLVCVLLQGAPLAQSKAQFRARLSPVPLDVAMQNVIAGSGTATATLTGNKLAISGTFSGLKSAATSARIHVAAKGLRGAPILDLTVTSGTSGTLSGTFELTPQRVDDLTHSSFYIQLNSEKAPEGNLRGWLLQESKK